MRTIVNMINTNKSIGINLKIVYLFKLKLFIRLNSSYLMRNGESTNKINFSLVGKKYPIFFSAYNLVFFFTKYREVNFMTKYSKEIFMNIVGLLFVGNGYFNYFGRKNYILIIGRFFFFYIDRFFKFNFFLLMQFMLINYFFGFLKWINYEKKFFQYKKFLGYLNLNGRLKKIIKKSNICLTKNLVNNKFLGNQGSQIKTINNKLEINGKKFVGQLIKGFLLIGASGNNIFVTILDNGGNTLVSGTGGNNNGGNSTHEGATAISSEQTMYEACALAKLKGLEAISIHFGTTLRISQIGSSLEGIFLTGLKVNSFIYGPIFPFGGSRQKKSRGV